MWSAAGRKQSFRGNGQSCAKKPMPKLHLRAGLEYCCPGWHPVSSFSCGER